MVEIKNRIHKGDAPFTEELKSHIIPVEADKYRPYFDEGWLRMLWPFLLSEDYKKIKEHLKSELKANDKITPNVEHMFDAFKYCKYEDLKVVIMGQDPYPQEGVADGLAFSTKKLKCPPSLGIIYRGIEEDIYKGLNLSMVKSPNLTYLAKQGVLLLNTALTTGVEKIGYHFELWRPFMLYLINILNKYNRGLVINSWGQVAQRYSPYFSPTAHSYIHCEHPAAAGHRGGMWEHRKCFSTTNYILEKSNGPSSRIMWDLSEINEAEYDQMFMLTE